MSQIHREYLTNENGNKKAVVIPLIEWQEIIEELDDIKAYNKAKSASSDLILFEEVVRQIHQRRLTHSK